MKWRPASEMPLQCCLLLCLALRAASSIRVVQGPSSRVLVDASAQRSTVAEPESIGTSAPLEPLAADELRVTAEEDRRFIGISPMPDDLLPLWNQASEAFGEFQREFVATGVISCNGKRKLEEAAVVLERLAQYAVGAEREFILYGRLQDVYATSTRLSPETIRIALRPPAGHCSEQSLRSAQAPTCPTRRASPRAGTRRYPQPSHAWASGPICAVPM